MRILFVANANQKFLGARTFGTDTRLYYGLVRNGHDVVFFSDRDQARLNAIVPSRKLGVKGANRYLMEVMESFHPEVIVLGHATVITTQTLKAIKEKYPHIPLVQFNVDALFSPTNARLLQANKEIVDATFITTGGSALKTIAAKSRPAYFIPNPTDRAIHDGRCFELDKPQHDMIFFAHNNPWDEQLRVELALHIREAVPEVNCFFRGFDGQPSIRGFDFCEAMRNAYMSLNISRSYVDGSQGTPEQLYLYSSERIAQLMGNGILTFCYTNDGFRLNDLYSEDEVVFFESSDELVEKVRYYNEHREEGKTIAYNGWKRAHQSFSSDKVADFVLDVALNRPFSHDYDWPTEGYVPD